MLLRLLPVHPGSEELQAPQAQEAMHGDAPEMNGVDLLKQNLWKTCVLPSPWSFAVLHPVPPVHPDLHLPCRHAKWPSMSD